MNSTPGPQGQPPSDGTKHTRHSGAADDAAVAVLRERLRAADEAIEVPHGLWDRVRADAPAGRRQRWAHRLVSLTAPSRRSPRLALVVAAALVGAIALGTWWLVRPATQHRPAPPAGARSTTITVHNAESACRELRTLECALRVAKDPYEQYAAPGNRAALAWHGDQMEALCVVADGTLVQDEKGITSTRWYLVRTAHGAEGWLPGVRTRNSAEVPDCVKGS